MRLQFPEAGLSLPRANSSSSSSPNAHGPRQCTGGSRGRRLGLRPSAVCCGPPQTAPVGTVHSPSLSPVSQTRPLPGGPTRPLQAAATGTAWDRRCWHLSKTPSVITPESRPPAPCEPGRDSSSVAGGWGGHALQTQCGVPRNNVKSCVHAEIDAREAEADTGRAQGSASMASPLMPACPTCACTCVPTNEVALCVRARAFCVCLQVRGCFSASRAAVRSCARGQH